MRVVPALADGVEFPIFGGLMDVAPTDFESRTAPDGSMIVAIERIPNTRYASRPAERCKAGGLPVSAPAATIGVDARPEGPPTTVESSG